MPISTHCPYCNAPLSRSDARFCSSCGQAQVVQQQPRIDGTTLPELQSSLSESHARTEAMQATLLVQDGAQTRLVALANQPVTLGRAADNAIIVSSRFVSGRHARIEPAGITHRIEDIGSTNGLLYEGRRIRQHNLADGDVLRIGDPTTGNFVTLTYHNPLMVRAPQGTQVAQSYALDPHNPQITIGRVDCDIVLNNPQVSRFHAQIDRLSDNQHLLRDAGSANGVFVNGQRITHHLLTAGDIIQIGPFKLVYNVTSLDQYDQRGALRIDAHSLSQHVRQGSTTKVVLHDISLSIAPREFVALVGGSGAGKSTLLKALCGYARAATGRVLINGDDYYRNFDAYRTVLGYVPQDDIIHHTLPVERALEYAAQLRLPADTAAQEITQRIEQVLDDVEITPYRKQLVEQLSGGQRKRVSIGAELLADPSLFFLDEPTSGLDPGLEKKMMYTLRRLADSGRTVILITHATANITQCDHIVFLAEGRVVYFGPPQEALLFFGITSGDFADIYGKLEGYADPQENNHWLVAQRDLRDEYIAWLQVAHPEIDPADYPSDTKNTMLAPAPLLSGVVPNPPSLAELWEAKYRCSWYYQHYVTDRLAQAPTGPIVTQKDTRAAGTKHPIALIRQFWILSRRYFDLIWQDQRNLLILLLQAPIIAFLLLLVTQSDALIGTQAQGLIQRSEAKKVLFMLATISVWFGIINAAREITKEIPIFQRERLVNLRIVAYISSKVAILSLLVLIQSGILLFVLGLKVSYPMHIGLLFPPILEIFVTILLTALAGMALGLGISAAVNTPDRAMSIVPLALIPQVVFAGLIFTIEGIATPLSWLTISRWAMNALGASVNLNTLCNHPNIDDRGSIPPGCSPNFLTTEIAFANDPSYLLSCWGILILYTIICLGFTAGMLKYRDRNI